MAKTNLAKSMEILQKASHSGDLDIGGIPIAAAVLEDGRRVLTQGSLMTAFGRTKNPKSGQGIGVDEKAVLPGFLRENNLESFIGKELESSTFPVPFITPLGGKSWGYSADLLPMICEVFIDADKAGVLLPRQRDILIRCEILMRGFARVGITALIDEATGLPIHRPRWRWQCPRKTGDACPKRQTRNDSLR